jgi:RNA polymerase sigma factor (sigma-70 family)
VVQAEEGLDQTLPELPRIGDYDEFFDNTYPLLLKIALAMGANIQDAEDAADDAMAAIYRRWGEIAQPRAYACKATKNAVVKAALRERERLDRTIAGGHLTIDNDDETAFTLWEDSQWVRQHLEALPPAQRAVMEKVVEGLSTAEIGALLGKTEATVRKNLQWARERLKVELAKERDHDNYRDRHAAKARRREIR